MPTVTLAGRAPVTLEHEGRGAARSSEVFAVAAELSVVLAPCSQAASPV